MFYTSHYFDLYEYCAPLVSSYLLGCLTDSYSSAVPPARHCSACCQYLIEPSRSVIEFQSHLRLSSSLQADTGDRFKGFLPRFAHLSKHVEMKNLVGYVADLPLIPSRREAVIRPQKSSEGLPTSLDARLAVMSVRVVAELLGALMERLRWTASVAIPNSLIDIDFSSLLTPSSGRERVAILLLTTHFPFYPYCIDSHQVLLNAHSTTWSVSLADFLSSIVA